MTEMRRDPREGWTQWEKDEFDARAEEEAWSHALDLLRPMREIAEMFGSPELERLLAKAQDEGDAELNRALDALEALQKRGEACD